MSCHNKVYCDGYPERCEECSHNTGQKASYTVNNINIQVSGGWVVQLLLLSVVVTLLIPSFSYGPGKVHHITGALVPDRSSIYYVTEVDKTA